MIVTKTDIPEVVIFAPKIFGDSRGWFCETWSIKAMEEQGFNYNFIQDNHAFNSAKGTLRGIHLQNGTYSQAKLVRCTSGAVLDVAIDLRIGSPTYSKWIAVELSAENKLQLLIPRGFGHAYLTLTDNVEFQYKVDNAYAPQSEVSIVWNDSSIGIKWGISTPILSDKDRDALTLKDVTIDYKYGEI